jgi:hypothetical protein
MAFVDMEYLAVLENILILLSTAGDDNCRCGWIDGIIDNTRSAE